MISTTNMTGFRMRSRGSSLRKACGIAARSRLRIEHAAGARRLAAGGLRAAEGDEALEASRPATEIDALSE